MEYLSDTIHPDDRPVLDELWGQIVHTPGVLHTVQLRGRECKGASRVGEFTLTNLLDDTNVEGIVANVRDITQQKTFEAQLTAQAFDDSLTSLPNRALLLDRIEQSIARGIARNGVIGVIFVDLDNFKRVND